MKCNRESLIRKTGDDATVKLLDMWHELTNKIYDVGIEVLVGDSKENPRLKAFHGSVNMAYPHEIDNKMVLILWINPIENNLLITHELGHWVLKLKGFQGLINRSEKHNNHEILLNSLAHHVPLYDLQRQCGHEPLDEIDARAQQNIRLFSAHHEEADKMMWIQNALLIADDLLNCSSTYSDELLTAIELQHKNTFKLVSTICDIRSHYELVNAAKNLRFIIGVRRALGMTGIWSPIDEIEELRRELYKIMGSHSENN